MFRFKIQLTLGALIFVTAACSQNNGNSGLSLNTLSSVSPTPSFLISPTPATSPTASSSPTAPATPTPTPTPNMFVHYSCPVIQSSGCSDESRCQSSCRGQFTDNQSTCTYYSANAVAHTAACTAVTTVNTIYSCAFVHSSGCTDGSLCESTCVGQLQAGGTCTYYFPNAVPQSFTCTSVKATTQPVYQCPRLQSISCTDASQCESSCNGQIQKTSTCTYYLQNAVAQTAACTFLGNQTF